MPLIPFLYLGLWIATLFIEPFEATGYEIIKIISVALLAIELRFNWRHLHRRLFETFRLGIMRKNLAFVAITSLLVSLLIIFAWPWLSALVLILVAMITTFQIGIAIGNLMVRKESIPNAASFPWALATAYEGSLNPNIRKTYGPFLYVIVPGLIASLLFDPRILVVIIWFQIDNIYTRLRMTVPMALFLTTHYEDSIEAWLRVKAAAGEFAIPSLILDEDGEVPPYIAIHQDLIRVRETDDWKTTVNLMMDHCRFIVFDTRNVSDAVKEELQLVRDRGDQRRVIFIQRDEMHPTMVSAAREFSRRIGRPCALAVGEIEALFSAERAKFVGKRTNPLTRKTAARKARPKDMTE